MSTNHFMDKNNATAVLTPYANNINNLKITALKELSPATTTHEVGTYLTYSGTIYKVKADIAVGDSLVIGTNIETAVIPEGAVVYWEDDTAPSVVSDPTKADKVVGAINGHLASLDANGNLADSELSGDTTTEVVTGNPLSFTTDSEQAARECVITLQPLQAGSGDPSPSNVRAISGYDEILIDINLWNTTISISGKYLTAAGEEINNEHYYITDYIEVEPNCSYEWHIPSEISANAPSICWYDDNKAYISGESINYRNSIIIATTNNTKYIRFSVYHENKNYRLYKLPILFNYSDSLPETVYGGTLNAETGELVVNRTIIDLGDMSYRASSSTASGKYRMLIESLQSVIKHNASGLPNLVCSVYKTRTIAEIDATIEGVSVDTYGNIAFYDANYDTSSSASAFKAAVTGQKLVYELATPYTIHLTPAQVRLLQGNNVVTTNGTSIKLTYRNGEVATLADVSSVAESVNVLGKKVEEVEDIKKYITFVGNYFAFFYAVKVGKVVNIAFGTNNDFEWTDGKKLFEIKDRRFSPLVFYCQSPIYQHSNGRIDSDGAVWIENWVDCKYYGTTKTGRYEAFLNYIVRDDVVLDY